MAMGNQRLKLWALIIIFAFTALFTAIPSAQAKGGSIDYEFTIEINQVFIIFFNDAQKVYDNIFRTFEKMFEKMLADIERSLEEALEEIDGDFSNNNGDDDDNDAGGRDGQKPQDQAGNDDADKNNDGKDGDQGANDQNGQQQGNKDDDFPELGNGKVKDDNGSNGNINSGQNIGSNPWDILNKRAQKPQDDKTGRDPQKPQNQGGDNEIVNPPAPQPPAPQPPVPPLPPVNNNQGNNTGNQNGNKKIDNPFDEMIKQQQRQAEEELNKHKQTDNLDGAASEIAQKIREKFGIEIVNAEYTWTAQELKMTYEILSELPMSFVQKTRVLAKGSSEKVFPGMGNCAGFASGSSITITPLGFSDYKRVLIHEMGHCFHFQTYELQNQFQQKFWSGRNGYSGSAGGANPPAISQYGGSNVMEDMAEAIAYYVVYGKSMKQMSPERYELVKNLVMEGKEW
jgi:hypothetical protein